MTKKQNSHTSVCVRDNHAARTIIAESFLWLTQSNSPNPQFL